MAELSPFKVPLLAFTMKVPCDGLPILEDWMVHASSIWAVGYEPWRESVEMKPVDASLLGQPLEFGSLEVTKGTGRVSILLFTVWYSYMKLKALLESDEERQEFRK